MVDDPSEYVDTLLTDQKRRKAERVYKARKKVWDERRGAGRGAGCGHGQAARAWPRAAVHRRPRGAGARRLFKIIEDLVLWENTTNEEVLQRRATRSGKAGAGRALTMRATRARRSCSIGTSCLRSTPVCRRGCVAA